MYHHITGKIAAKHPAHLIVENGGFGYRINIPLSTHNKVGKVGDTVKLLLTPHIREDDWALYGFASEEERGLFELLLTVSGVGPKSALAALSGMSAQQFRTAIAANDVDKLTLIPGVGKKTAQRIALELKDKVKALPGDFEAGLPLEAEYGEAVLALEALGFSRVQAEKAVERVMKSGGADQAEEIIRRALGVMGG